MSFPSRASPRLRSFPLELPRLGIPPASTVLLPLSASSQALDAVFRYVTLGLHRSLHRTTMEASKSIPLPHTVRGLMVYRLGLED